MKTPHRIKLIRGENIHGRYNPETDSYDTGISSSVIVPCLVNFVSQAKVFKEYGHQTDKIMICRFQQGQEPFQKALYNNEYYVPIDKIDDHIKGAVRLKRVGDSNG